MGVSLKEVCFKDSEMNLTELSLEMGNLRTGDAKTDVLSLKRAVLRTR